MYRRTALCGKVLATLALIASAYPAHAVRIAGHIPWNAVSRAQNMGYVAHNSRIPLALTLPIRNADALNNLLVRLYNPADPLYGHYLTPQEFTEQFGPTQSDYDAVAAFARNAGLTIDHTYSNRLVLDVHGSAAVVERAFHTHLWRFRGADGREFRSPDQEPAIPNMLAGRIAGVIGLETASFWHKHSERAKVDISMLPWQVGSGPGSALAPSDIKSVYNLNNVSASGAGQTLALFELDAYTSSDIAGYENYYFPGKSAVPLSNILVDGGPGSPGSGADEVTLDIELMLALAPDAAQILVYEGPNSGASVIDTYNRIATDDLAKVVSTSWGMYEAGLSRLLSSENSIFAQMAAQGQTIIAASGDNGANDNGTSLSVDDPSSQPDVTGVGGTSLSVGAGETYGSETAWHGGGGVSSRWSLPSWQAGLATSANLGSTSYRMVPDVSLDSDPYTGYSIYFNGGWTIYGGTSCAAPLWAAFTALANEMRGNLSPLGFLNPTLYNIGSGPDYTQDFHDVADHSTNGYYPAVPGYDLATGWGSFNGANLLSSLAPPATPTGPVAVGGPWSVRLVWNAASGATSYNLKRSTVSGGPYTTIASAPGVSYLDTTARNGTRYYYVISAVNSIGESANSSEVNALPHFLFRIPGQ